MNEAIDETLDDVASDLAPDRRTTSVAEVSASAEAVVGMPVHRFATEFESLGPDCKLGLVQRACGAEPLSFTRFSSIPLTHMILGLHNRFSDVDDPSKIEIRPFRTVGLTYWAVHVPNYQLSYRTPHKVEEIDPEVVHRSESRSIRFRRDKFLIDLQAGEKTFVTWRDRQASEQLSLAAVEPLFAAVRRYGPVRVMWLVEDEHAPSVEEVRPGLICGHIARLGSFQAWMPTLVKAWLLCHAAQSTTAAGVDAPPEVSSLLDEAYAAGDNIVCDGEIIAKNVGF